MVRGTIVGEQILEYLKAAYPKAFTIDDICEKTRFSQCAAGGWLRTLVSRRKIEICGKQGRHNLYRFVPDTK